MLSEAALPLAADAWWWRCDAPTSTIESLPEGAAPATPPPPPEPAGESEPSERCYFSFFLRFSRLATPALLSMYVLTSQ